MMLVVVAVVLLCSCACQGTAARAGHTFPHSLRTKPLTEVPVKRTLVVSIGDAAPDCYPKRVVLINGQFQPALELWQNDLVEITVINNIPVEYPTTSHGISVHWHGLRMAGNASWFDGVSYTHMCPIPPGGNFTYFFKVDETPGTYFYHDHATSLTADGLQGALIIHPPRGPEAVPEPFSYDEEHTLYITDWWHGAAGPMAMLLNRPLDASKASEDAGVFQWVGNPQAFLVNGVGVAQACSAPLMANLMGKPLEHGSASVADVADVDVQSAAHQTMEKTVHSGDVADSNVAAAAVQAGSNPKKLGHGDAALDIIADIHEAEAAFSSGTEALPAAAVSAGGVGQTASSTGGSALISDVRKGVAHAFHAVKRACKTGFGAVKGALHTAFGAVKRAAVGTFHTVKDAYIHCFNAVKAAFVSGFHTLQKWLTGNSSAGTAAVPRLLHAMDMAVDVPASKGAHDVSASDSAEVSGVRQSGGAGVSGDDHRAEGPTGSGSSLAGGGSVGKCLPTPDTDIPGCKHARIDVTPGATHRLRLIGGMSLVYLSVCFEGHSIEVVAADGMPTNPIVLDNGCVDLNSGQRMDILLTANQPIRDYWITLAPHFRPGTVTGYAVLSYNGQPTGAARLPMTSPPPDASLISPWTDAQQAQIKPLRRLHSPRRGDERLVAQYLTPYGMRTLEPPLAATRSLRVMVSQPMMENGMVRWALNNVVMQKSPPCDCTMQLIHNVPNWMSKHEIQGNLSAPLNQSHFYEVTDFAAGFNDVGVFSSATPMPTYPALGLHLTKLSHDAIVDVLIQNNAADSFHGGDEHPACNTCGDNPHPNPDALRMDQEQHPMHLHGHKFWVLGSGQGEYDGTQELNTEDPPVRDTATLHAGGWLYLRFVANSPGIWPLHCHILWHLAMGQQMAFVVAPERFAPPPPGMGKRCLDGCRNGAGPYNKAWVAATYNNGGKYQLPP